MAKRQIKVRAVRKQQIDEDRLALALLLLARSLLDAEQRDDEDETEVSQGEAA